jgi:curved DNA-binding protein CbpA
MTRDEAAALLGVAVETTGPDVQKAFLRLARRVHPDVLPDATDAQRREAAERFDTFDAGLRRHEFQSPVDGATTIPTATP